MIVKIILIIKEMDLIDRFLSSLRDASHSIDILNRDGYIFSVDQWYMLMKEMYQKLSLNCLKIEDISNREFMENFERRDGLREIGKLLKKWNTLSGRNLRTDIEPNVFYDEMGQGYSYVLKKSVRTDLCEPFDMHIIIEYLMCNMDVGYIVETKFWRVLHEYKWMTLIPYVMKSEMCYVTGRRAPLLVDNRPMKRLIEYPGYRGESDIDAEYLDNRYEIRHINLTGITESMWNRKELRRYMIRDPIFSDYEIKIKAGDIVEEVRERVEVMKVELMKYCREMIYEKLKDTVIDERKIRKEEGEELRERMTIEEWMAIKSPEEITPIVINGVRLWINRENKVFSYAEGVEIGEMRYKDGYIEVVNKVM